MMTFEKFVEKKNNIMRWLPEVLESQYQTAKDFGHLQENHVNKNFHFLMSRSAKEKIDASTFLGDIQKIMRVLRNGLKENAEQIAEYLADDGYEDDAYEIDFDIKGLKGYIFYYDANMHNWDDGAIECTMIRVIIKKQKGSNGFYIKTAYPY